LGDVPPLLGLTGWQPFLFNKILSPASSASSGYDGYETLVWSTELGTAVWLRLVSSVLASAETEATETTETTETTEHIDRVISTIWLAHFLGVTDVACNIFCALLRLSTATFLEEIPGLYLEHATHVHRLYYR